MGRGGGGGYMESFRNISIASLLRFEKIPVQKHDQVNHVASNMYSTKYGLYTLLVIKMEYISVGYSSFDFIVSKS